jgi:hypothetical protein
LIEDRRHNSRKLQDDEQPPGTAATTEAPAQVNKPAPEEAEVQAISKPVAEAAPEKEAAKGGLFACFPCCS